jgi:hypothetical protein
MAQSGSGNDHMTETKHSTRQGHEATQDRHATAHAEETADERPGMARGRVDQASALLSRGLDLAEAGLSLGVTLVNRVSVAAQQQIVERFMNQPPAVVDPGAAPPPPAAPEPEPEPYGIGNRLPLLPGGEVKVSFSINNDSMEAPKKVALSLDGFVGDTHGHRLDIGGFAVTPARKTIAPMDFEKFVLKGPLPRKALPDRYRGWVIVDSDTELRIPVCLVVSSL